MPREIFPEAEMRRDLGLSTIEVHHSAGFTGQDFHVELPMSRGYA